MKGYRFYEEFGTKANKRKGVSQGNVIAASLRDDGSLNYYHQNGQALVEGLNSVYESANSPVCWSSMSIEYIQETCKRVSEARAREIHPKLFDRLDS